jgi:hypothetical protein
MTLAMSLGALSTAAVVGAPAAGAKSGGLSSCPKSGQGVVRGFCGGPAKVTVTVGTKTYQLNHGTCVFSGGYYSINAGTVVSSGHKGKKPDYVGMDLPSHSGAFTNALIEVTVAGKGNFVSPDTGTLAANMKSGAFTGQASGPGQPTVNVNGKFTC